METIGVKLVLVQHRTPSLEVSRRTLFRGRHLRRV